MMHEVLARLAAATRAALVTWRRRHVVPDPARCGLCRAEMDPTIYVLGDGYCARCNLARVEARAIFATLERKTR